MKKNTLLFLLKDDKNEILLAMKKRGFGVGKYNGVGGKVMEGESIPDAAAREAHEEISVAVPTQNIIQVAMLTFHFKDKPDWDIECHTFFTRVWVGEPAESEEMKPEWFNQNAIPFEKMWIDDKYWLPMVLRGDQVTATFWFSNDGSELLKYAIEGNGVGI